MNLAEFPLSVLSTRSNSKIKTLEFSDAIKGRDGESVNRRWIITGADKFGLPTASDDEVLLGLLKLTVDAGFTDRKVFFTRYELLRILRWTTEGRSYSRLQRALDRLSGVRIKATNAFYDNESKSHSTRNFGIIDAYEINDGRNLQPKPSFFTWSEVLFKSFQVGFIKKLDLDFYLTLKSAISKRLYRYLDKHFWYRSKLQTKLFLLAHEKVGISRNYRHLSSIRQQLDPALEELRACGFIDRAEYVGRGSDADIVIIAGRGRTSQPKTTEVLPREKVSSSVELSTHDRVLDLLMTRGIREPQARRLLHGKAEASLERMVRIVEHFDQLCGSGSHLVSRSPVGFLYRAIENAEQFSLAGDQTKKSAQSSLPLAARQERRPAPQASDREADYLVARKVEIRRLRESVEPAMLSNLHKEVESAMAKLKSLISAERFEEAIAHGVDEKLAKLFAFPDFHEWSKLKR